MRVRATAPQARLGLEDRRGNVRNAFECRESLTGRSVILVDDVLTSGASLDELARTVRLHGAQHVLAAVVGRTLHG
jgi:predicted amidophosphoribosyltransferase